MNQTLFFAVNVQNLQKCLCVGSFGIRMSMPLLLLQIMTWFTLSRHPPPPSPHPSAFCLEKFERSENLARLDSRLWHGPTNLNTEMCRVSFPALFLPPRPSSFSVENLICSCRYSRLWGRYTSAEGATIFPLTPQPLARLFQLLMRSFEISTSSGSVSVGS